MKKALIALMALALVAAFAMPAAAAEKSEVSFGGYVAFDTWVVDNEGVAQDLDGDGEWDGAWDDTDLIWSLEEVCTRFNASFKRENFTGFVELRPLGGVSYRHWYAEWNFGPGYLLIGQTWAPSFMPVSSSVGPWGGGCSADAGDTGYGAGRDPMIRLRFPFSMGEFTFAAMDPSEGGTRTVFDDTAGQVVDDEDYTLPRLEAKLAMSMGPVSFNLVGGWLEWEEVFRDQEGNNDFSEDEFDIDAWIVAANAKFTAGPFSLAMAGWMGENPVEYGYYAGTEQGAVFGTNLMPTALIEDTDADGILDRVSDVDAWGAYISVGFKLNDMVSFAAGGGTREFDGEYDGFSVEDETTHWYVNSTITVAEGFTLTPEVGEFDYETNDWTFDNADPISIDEGSDMYYGIWWKMVF